ncbi:hypothetical protein ACOMHN_065855 [Nucella lapillus]
MDFKSGSTTTTTPPQSSRRTRGGGGGGGSGEGGGKEGEAAGVGESRGGGGGDGVADGERGSSDVPACPTQHGPPDSAAAGSHPGGRSPTPRALPRRSMSTVEDGRKRISSTKDHDTPPSTPPPRPPPPRQPPSLREMREKKERILQRMTSMPSYSRSDSPPARANRHLSMNGGKNISLDQPYYPKPASSTEGTDSQPANEGQFQKEMDDTSTTMDRVSLRGDSAQTSAPPTPKPSSEVKPTVKNDASKRVPSERLTNKPDQTDVPQTDDPKQSTKDPSRGNRAPKFTTTKRRSSTVDEMLFDDYVEPEVEQVKTAFSPGNLPQDLMSFDQEASEKAASAGVTKPEDGSADELQSPGSMDSSDAEYGDAAMPRSTSQMSDKSWSSNYSLDSQPDDITVECMEFMKAFVEKVFSVE